MESTNINDIVSAVNNVNFFQFHWINQRDSAARLERVLGEFLGQLEIDSEVDYSPEEFDNFCAALKLTQMEDYGDHIVMPSISLVEGAGVIALIADYTTVWLLPNGVCIVDQRQQSEAWYNGEGGFFATQPGTAFARTMAHGFVPEPVEFYELFRFVTDEDGNPVPGNISDYEFGPEDFSDVHRVSLASTGAIAVYEKPDSVPTIYAI